MAGGPLSYRYGCELASVCCAVLCPACVSHQVCVEGPKEKLDTTAISQVGREGGLARKGGRCPTSAALGACKPLMAQTKSVREWAVFLPEDALIASCCVAAAAGPCVACVALTPTLCAVTPHSRPSMLPALLLLRSCVPLRVPPCWTLWTSPAASAWGSTQHSHLQVRGGQGFWGFWGGLGSVGVCLNKGSAWAGVVLRGLWCCLFGALVTGIWAQGYLCCCGASN